MIEVFALIVRGLTIAEALIEAGQTAGPAIKALVEIAKKAESGEKVTDVDLANTEAVLDQLIEEFNLEV